MLKIFTDYLVIVQNGILYTCICLFVCFVAAEQCRLLQRFSFIYKVGITLQK